MAYLEGIRRDFNASGVFESCCVCKDKPVLMYKLDCENDVYCGNCMTERLCNESVSIEF